MMRCPQSRGMQVMLRSVVCVLVVCGVVLSIAPEVRADLPGLKNVQAPSVSIEEAREFYAAHTPEEYPIHAAALQEAALRGATDAATAIQELAVSLNHDPDQIYEYVHNNIAYTPIFGSVKGAGGTLFDQEGNDFDQAALMIALLREAGLTANFVYGVIRLQPDEITNWLDVENDPAVIGTLLGSAGIPATIYTYSGGSLAYADVDHVWVSVTIEGTDYVFDPSFKQHTSTPPVDLATVMGYDQASFLSQALSGATIGSNYLQHINTANIATALSGYASNLVNYIQTNAPKAELKDIIGGRAIDPVNEPHLRYFDSHGRTVREIDALGRETRSEYDTQQRLIRVTMPEGNSIEYQYDGRHNPTQIITHPKPGSTESPITRSMTYEPTYNKVQTSTDPMGNTTTFSYDGSGNLERIEQPQAGGQTPVTTFTYTSRGQVETITDPEAMVTFHLYHPSGDLLMRIVDNTGVEIVTLLTYDAVGNVETITDPLGRVTTTTYDAMRRPLSQTAPLSHTTSYAYDKDGHLLSVTKNGQQTTSFTYTPTGKTQTVTDPENHTTTYTYDDLDRLWKVTNAESQTVEYQYDAIGRVTAIIDNAGNTARAYTYTLNGQTETQTDANSNTTTYTYDDFDRLKKVIYPDQSYEEILEYNPAGDIWDYRTRNGQEFTYLYDNLQQKLCGSRPQRMYISEI